MDKLKAMATFVQIAEAGSLSAAARASGASLPAVVRTLAALEAELGVRLFNRTTRRIALTGEGRHYMESCRNLLAALGEAESALRDEAGDPSGLLTVTAPVLFGQMYVAPAVTAFVQRHAGMRCRLLLLDRRSPGKTTQIEWNEVGCGGQQAYSTMGQDLFLLAGTNQQLSVERPLQTSGDHLIRLLSDATTRYQLRIETVKN